MPFFSYLLMLLYYGFNDKYLFLNIFKSVNITDKGLNIF